MPRTFVFCVWLLIILGCVTTDDPRQGGLFSYNPAAYERRLEELRRLQENQERQRQILQEEADQLQRQEEATQQRQDQQREQLGSLDEELAELESGLTRMQQDVERYHGQTTAQQRDKQRVMGQVQALQRRLSLLRQTPQTSPQEEAYKRSQQAELAREVDTLLAITAALTSSSR